MQLRARTHPQNLRSMALLITLGFERIEAPDGQGRNDGADPADVEFIRNVRSTGIVRLEYSVERSLA